MQLRVGNDKLEAIIGPQEFTYVLAMSGLVNEFQNNGLTENIIQMLTDFCCECASQMHNQIGAAAIDFLTKSEDDLMVNMQLLNNGSIQMTIMPSDDSNTAFRTECFEENDIVQSSLNDLNDSIVCPASQSDVMNNTNSQMSDVDVCIEEFLDDHSLLNTLFNDQISGYVGAPYNKCYKCMLDNKINRMVRQLKIRNPYFNSNQIACLILQSDCCRNCLDNSDKSKWKLILHDFLLAVVKECESSSVPYFYEVSNLNTALDLVPFIDNGGLYKVGNKYYVGTNINRPVFMEYGDIKDGLVLSNDDLLCKVVNGELQSKK